MKKNINKFNQSLSGAEFSIIKKKNNLFLKKIISYKKIDDKNRIIKNISKQNFFASSVLPDPFFTIRTNHYIKNKTITLEMPFIHGISGKEIISNSQKKNVDILISILKKLLVFFKKNELETNSNIKLNFIRKIEELESFSFNKKYKYAFTYINKLLEKTDLNISETLCHGDLTFSNIILTKSSNFKTNFRESNFLLIDLLDTYFNSYLQDLAKLKQELFYGWSSRLISSPQKINNLITGEYIWENLSNYFMNDNNRSIFKIIMILCILRITPYAKSKKDFDWIENALKMEIRN